MDDLISRQAAEEALASWNISFIVLDHVPSADVVEIIRCKDCIHHASFLPWCKEHETRMNDNDYCSKGEHK